ncbi:branched-chain amino acid ABC transporter permease [Ferroglobus sp.]|uniref:branched-chain amino acid ABC transporter permease n=1 Tax=Ferroglobus sp. TaxID=2614230 RepID=UPI0025BDF201|nr:branched-chain amino acid ABC transporter permease [Ferroglobus sp.]
MRAKFVLIALLLAAYAAYPLISGDSYIMRVLILVHIFAILAASLDLIVGYTGQLTAGHTAIWGWGAYFAAWSILYFNFPPAASLLVSAVVGALLGFGIGILCLRFKYLLLTLVTFAILILSYAIARQFTSITGGELGIHGIPKLSDNILVIFYVSFAALIATIAILLAITKSEIGLRMRAIKDSEEGAKVLGVDVVKYKVLANVIGSTFAGFAGGLYTTYMGSVGSTNFYVDHLLRLILMWGIGGGGSIIGPAIGAYIVMLLSEYLRVIEEYRLILFGAALIVILRVFPSGVYGIIKKVLGGE